MLRGVLAAAGVGTLAVPAIAVLAALAMVGDACVSTGGLAVDAPVPTEARAWVAAAVGECPELPEAWVAAVMAQESGFRPDAYADDSNGGTWGLFQMNASVWAGAYGHPWSADLNGNDVWDVREGDIHATVAGRYLCDRLAGVRTIRAEHPDWASSTLPVLDALIIAHNAGESRLRTYPTIPAVTGGFIANVHERVAAWSTVPTAAGTLEPQLDALPGSTNHPVLDATAPLPASGTGCLTGLGSAAGEVLVPAGTPHDVTAAVTTALSYVGVRSGWDGLCDRLACRAYGYVGSGYYSAATHWAAMLDGGQAHPGDGCPPLGSFVFFDTGRIYGHVSVVVKSSPTCDWSQTFVTSNATYDHLTGYDGGVYLTTIEHLNAGYVRRASGYLGWAEPVCQGASVAAGTQHPAASGW